MHSPDSKPKTQQNWLYLVIAIIAIGAGFWVASSQQNKNPQKTASTQSEAHQTIPTLKAGTYLPDPRKIQAFQLLDFDKKPFTPESLKGKWSMMFFGYTNCPDVCPAALLNLKLVSEKLSKTPGFLKNIQVIFVSVDPDRDSPTYLKQFVQYYHKDFKGATGTDSEIKKLTKQLGVLYMKTPQQGSDNYLVDHSAAIILTDPDGRFSGIFSAPHNASDIADDLITIQKHFKR